MVRRDGGAPQEGWFSGAGGLSLFRRTWRPAGPTRAVLINVHGLGDHSGLYPTLVQFFTARDIAVYAYDMRGNGRSPGQRAYVKRVLTITWGTREFSVDWSAQLSGSDGNK
jgi:alpha-beta hydrolase superfamily lysophospholipase